MSAPFTFPPWAGADLAQLGGLLVDLDVAARPQQRERGTQAAQAGTGDQYTHDFNILHPCSSPSHAAATTARSP